MSQISQFLMEEPLIEENSVMSVSLRQAFVSSEGKVVDMGGSSFVCLLVYLFYLGICLLQATERQ